MTFNGCTPMAPPVAHPATILPPLMDTHFFSLVASKNPISMPITTLEEVEEEDEEKDAKECWVLWSSVMFDLIDDPTQPDPNNVVWFLMGDLLRLIPWSGGLGR